MHIMLKPTKTFLMLFLIVLQFIAPFLHAHAFGLDDNKQSGFHIHSDEISALNFNNISANKSYIDTQQIVGAVVTVASGNKLSDADDLDNHLAMVAILFAFVIFIFGGLRRYMPRHFQVANQLQPYYSLQNPRAPPR